MSSGFITLFPPSGVVHYDLTAIFNIHTDGSGNLDFNVIGSASEFTFACVDEGAAQRIARYILSLKTNGATGEYAINASLNFPTGAITCALYYFDPQAPGWYMYLIGTNLTASAFVSFGGSTFQVDPANSSSTAIKTLLQSGPVPYGDYMVQTLWTDNSVLASWSTQLGFHYQVSTCTPNPFIMGTDDVLVNGSDFDNSTLGKVSCEGRVGCMAQDTGHCSATFVSVNQLSAPAGGWSGAGGSAPFVLFYRDSNSKQSNVINVASIT